MMSKEVSVSQNWGDIPLMFLFLIPALLSVHTAFLARHVHFYAHVIFVILVLVLPTICSVRPLSTSIAIRTLPSPPTCAAHNARRISAPLLALLSTSAIHD
jgi:hypothetical protein